MGCCCVMPMVALFEGCVAFCPCLVRIVWTVGKGRKITGRRIGTNAVHVRMTA